MTDSTITQQYNLTVTLAGDDAPAVGALLASIVAAGALDLALLALLRDELRGAIPDDWRIVAAVLRPAGEVTP